MSTSTSPAVARLPKSVLLVGGIRKHIDAKITPGLRDRGLDVKWLWETTQAPGTIPPDCEIVLIAADVATKPQQDAARFQAKARNLPLVNVTAYKWETTAAALTRAGFEEPVAETPATAASVEPSPEKIAPPVVPPKAAPAPAAKAAPAPPAPAAKAAPAPAPTTPTTLLDLFAAYRPSASASANGGTLNVYDSYVRCIERLYGNLPLKDCAEFDARIYDDAESGKLDRFKKEHHWTGKAWALAREKGWLPPVTAGGADDIEHRGIKAALSTSRTLPDGRGRFAWTFRPPLGRGKNGGKKTQTSTAVRLKADEVTTYIDLHLDAMKTKNPVKTAAVIDAAKAKAALEEGAAARKAAAAKAAQARWGPPKKEEPVPAEKSPTHSANGALGAKARWSKTPPPPPLTVSPPAPVVLAAATPAPPLVPLIKEKPVSEAAPAPAPAKAAVPVDPWLSSQFVERFLALRTSMAALGIPEMTLTGWNGKQPGAVPSEGIARDVYNLQLAMVDANVRSVKVGKDGLGYERVVVVTGFEPL
jgi:hypothetical protein